ncbi:HTH domain-containing protein [Sinimarinibacterium sp. CAU 1509]|uniref:helix-turn-helix transcriptional regulator n=1 Tax=Sinimarinibacterium sp. CAU 1509 TaxID=2562283 RepID=UPI0010AC77D9|nr:HTH domain-containing protein [Sinimarinibacterium sp. CAU 1509]TJY55416.1 HTH domain-containing protein [Sinimarinibacterium sp. CAU 1509]
MLDLLGRRQKDLLRLLLRHKDGLTVDELGQHLGITRNAVRQHLTALEADGIVCLGSVRPTRGRPTQVYALSVKGKELFPRQYGWLAQLIVESIRQEAGGPALRKRLTAMGIRVAEQLRQQHTTGRTRQDKVLKLAELMEQLGYSTSETSVLQPNIISADNCVFHDLAQKDPEICQFDLALLSTYTDSNVDLQECMAKGGNVCRFKFRSRTQ